jgi:DMSO/TMAO reductase YedYZ molybdopterin-dependent catalytic subunit
VRFQWANTLLLWLVSGSSDRAIFILAHRVAGYAILVLLVWKGAVIASSLRRRGPGPRRYGSLFLLAGLVVTLSLGLAWSAAGPFAFAWFNGLSWHIYAGAALTSVLVWHAYRYAHRLPVSFWAERRTFLRLTALAVGGLAVMRAAEVGVTAAGLNGARRRFTGSYPAPAREGGRFPVVSWLNDRPTPIDPAAWSVTIGGAVRRELVLRQGDLEELQTVTATIDCTGGWYSEQVWQGAPLGDLLKLAGPDPTAASVTVTSVTGYYRRFSMDEANRYLLATRVGGRRLSHGHGYPLRLVAPGKRGFEWIKWVSRIEVNDSPKWLQPPLPLQ